MSDLQEGMRDQPEGDPRVLFVLNVLLSAAFAWLVFWLLDFGGYVAFSWTNVGIMTLVLVLITQLAILR